MPRAIAVVVVSALDRQAEAAMSSRWKLSRRHVLIAVAIIAVFVFIVQLWEYVTWYRPDEAYYRLRPTSWWAMHSQSGTFGANAFGENLVFWNYQRGPCPRQAWQDWLSRVGITIEFSDSTPETLMAGDPAALPVLQELLADLRPPVRYTAVYGLMEVAYKHKSQKALAVLQSVADDDDGSVRFMARQTLRQMQGQAGNSSILCGPRP